MNFKVFPGTITRDGRKIPLIKGWKEKATTDKDQLTKWSNEFGQAIKFWGAPTGKVNDIFVLDVDVKNGNGFETLKKFPSFNTVSQTTPSGGRHYIFKRPDNGSLYGNTVGFLPHLDTRCEDGYIGLYNNLEGEELSEVPEWILNNVVKKHEKKEVNEEYIYKLSGNLAQEKLNLCLDLIRNAPPGESNDTLNAQSYVLGQLVRSGNFEREFIEGELLKAALDRGKPEYEAKATIQSGLMNGIDNPLMSPFKNGGPDFKFHVEKNSYTKFETPEEWLPKPIDIFDLTNVCNLKKPQLFKDWSTEDIHLTTADGGTGKTTLKLYESVCLALGERFLGFIPEQRGKTLFITGEDSEKKITAILGQICEQMSLYNCTPESNEKLNTIINSIIIKKDDNLNLMFKNQQGFLEINEPAYDKILKAVKTFKPKMIVFDPIAAFWGPESMVNDMTKTVAKFMGRLVEDSKACVEMINHMGKASSNSKDMSQFAGRGGTALPSHSRVSRVLRGVDANEFNEMTGKDLKKGESAILCNVNKFTDGSKLLNKPFLILRNNFLFTKVDITNAVTDKDDPSQDVEKVFNFIKNERNSDRYPSKDIIESHFYNGKIMSKARCTHALSQLQYSGFKGVKIREIDNPDESIRAKAYILVSLEGNEI